MSLMSCAPHTFCDCRCGICPLAPGCSAPSWSSRQSWEHSASLQDPGAGIALNWSSLDRAVAGYALAAVTLARGIPDTRYPALAEPASNAVAGARLMRLTVARVRSIFYPGDLTWVPLILLLERTVSDVTLATDQLICGSPRDTPATLLHARARLQQALAPWHRAVPPGERALLRHLAEQGRAPSPFCHAG